MKINSFLHPFEKNNGQIHNSIIDLHIDEVVDGVIASSDKRRFITEILSEFEQNEENLLYRQEIIKDFLSYRYLYEDIEDSFRKAYDLGTEYKALKKEQITTNKYFSTFDVKNYNVSGIILLKYANIIISILDLYRDFERVLRKYDFKSRGLKEFKDHILFVFNNKGSDELYALMQKLIKGHGEDYDFRVTSNEKFNVLDVSFLDSYNMPKPDRHRIKKGLPSNHIDINQKTMFELEYMISVSSSKVVDVLTSIFEELYAVFSETSKELPFFEFALRYNDYMKQLNIGVCFPTFNHEKTIIHDLADPYLAIKGYLEAHRPISVTPNDLYLDINDGGVLVLGENNTGKTVYTRSIGINQVFAQAGLFVCAKSADIKLQSQVITCYASKESHEFDGGRFETEVRALKFILDEADTDSMIIINEIFQSTREAEGTDALFNVLEYLTFNKMCWICVSHFLELEKKRNDFISETNKKIKLCTTRVNNGVYKIIDKDTM